MKSVILKAPVLTNSGYGVHSRQVARYLIDKADRGEIKLYIIPVRWGDTPWLLDDSKCDGLVGRIFKYVRYPNTPTDVSIQLLLPNEWDRRLATVNIGMSAVVETDKCNPMWVDACNMMDLVIVPSSFTKGVLENSGDVKTDVKVIPESYIDALDDDVHHVDFGFETDFNYLVVGQFTSANPEADRKNIFNTLKILCNVHRNDENIGVIVKTNLGRGTYIDRKKTRDKFVSVLKAVRKGTFPRIHLLHGDLSDREMAALYRDKSVKALLSLTHGEGYGLPLLEAARAGLPIIATDWSGHLDFLSHGKFIKIGYRLENIPHSRIDVVPEENERRGMRIWIEGARWANPIESHVVSALKKFSISPDPPKQWAMELSEKIRELYSFESISKLYDDVFSTYIM